MPFYTVGGISQYIIQLSSAIAEMDSNNEYTILCSRKDRRSYLPEKAHNFRRVNVWTPAHHRFERWAFALEIAPLRLDVLHSPDFIPPRFGAGSRIVTIHDLNFWYYPEFLTQDSLRYYRDQIAWAVSEADRISVDSDSTREDVIKQLNANPRKVVTIPLAAAPIFNNEHARSEVNKTLSALDIVEGFVLFVGTLSPRKNLETLIKAFTRLQRTSGPSRQLVIVGNRGWLNEGIFDAMNSTELDDEVLHFESLNDVQLAHLYSAAGVLALPSFYEGFGLPLLEAMQCGCPVIASNTSSLPEVAGSAGILLDPLDVNGWADAIGTVLSDQALRGNMIARGFKQASRFSWERSARETIALYQDAVTDP